VPQAPALDDPRKVRVTPQTAPVPILKDLLFILGFIDNDASLLLVMLRCFRLNPVNTFEISSIMQSSPLVRW